MPVIASTAVAAYTTSALVSAGTVVAGSLAAQVAFATVATVTEFGILKLISFVFDDNKDEDPRFEVPADPGIAEDVNQSIPAMQFAVGEVTVNLRYLFWNSTSTVGTFVDNRITAENPGPYLDKMYGVCCHRSELISSSVGGIPVQSVPFGNGYSTAPRFLDANGLPMLAESFRGGTPDQGVDPIVRRNHPDVLDTFVQANHSTWTGEWYYGENRDQHEEIWGDLRNLATQVRIRGLFGYDPTDANQDPDEPRTHRSLNLAPQVIANLLTNGLFLKRPLSWDLIDIPALKRSIEIARVKMPTRTGDLVHQYPISGVFNTNERPGDVIDQMRLACHCEILFKAGKYHIEVGEPKAPVMTVHDGMVIGAQSYSRSPRLQDRIDALSVRCVVPEADFQLAALPIITDLVGAQAFTNPESIQQRFLEGSSVGQRIGWTMYRRAQLQKTISLQMADEAVLLDAGDVIDRQSELVPESSGLYIVHRIEPSRTVLGSFEVDAKQYDPFIYNWDPQLEQEFQPGTLRLDI